MKTQFLPLLAIITLMGFTASVANAYDHDSIKDSNTETADATAEATAATGNASSAAQNVNVSAKRTEDKLDDAQKAQDAVTALGKNASAAAIKKAQDDVDTATVNANFIRDGSGNPANVDAYRQALKERRDARKRLKLAIANLQRLIQLNNQTYSTDVSEYNHTVRDAKKAESDVDSHVAMVETPADTQVYVAVHPHYEESEIHSHVARHQDRETVRENDKQVVSLIISLHPSCDR